jgi:uncharacterized SAM-binding protein YcdF (DUF218 family)
VTETADPPTKPAQPPRPRWRWLRGTTMAAVLLVALWALSVASVHGYGRRDERRTADAIVVLGAAQYDGRPSPVLRARLEHAVALYDEGVAPVIIMTGGTGPGDTVSEAVVGRRFALKRGVPAEAVLVETEGMTSLQSLRGVAGMMRERGMHRAVLVSDPFHSLRLKLLAWRLGFEAFTSPTRTSPISRNQSEERRAVLRESVSLPYAMLEAAISRGAEGDEPAEPPASQ